MHNLGVSGATRAARITHELREMIRSGELAPGTRLRQDHLAAQFGVSSTPVREALATLAKERLIRHSSHRGAIVFPPTMDDVRENFEIRLALEPLATELAAVHVNGERLRHLREELLPAVDAAVESATRDGAAERYESADREFHNEIFAAAERPRLLEMIQSLRDAAASYAHLHTPEGIDPDLLRRLHKQHGQLLDMLEQGDPSGARQLALDHVLLTAHGSGLMRGDVM